MVGILIGLIVIVVTFNILAVAEAYKRATVGLADAQITGLLSQFMAGRDAGNGGAGITMSGADLIKCTHDEAGNALLGMPVTKLDVAVRPIPVLVTDGGGPGVSDNFIALNAGAPHVMWPVDFTATSEAGAPITVHSPNGFTVPPPATKPYWAIVMANDDSGRCKMVRIVAATAADSLGDVALTQGGPVTAIAYQMDRPAKLLNLGPVGMATRIRYDIDAANAVLRTTDLLAVPPAAPTPVPIAQNVVLMKMQYGVGPAVIPTGAHDGIVTCWTAATNGSACSNGVNNDFGDAAVRNFSLAQLHSILAVRIGIVVRSDEPDLQLLTDPSNAGLRAEARGLISRTRSQPYLFNCSANTDAACEGRVKVPMGAGADPASPGCLPAIICDYWRYRTYELVVPIRNSIYSATLPP
jgi:Type IV Pilus-assembly protein W